MIPLLTHFALRLEEAAARPVMARLGIIIFLCILTPYESIGYINFKFYL